jgi:hypothetical protein
MARLEGNYRARGVAGSEQFGTTKNGADQVVIDLELLDVGQTVSTFLYFSEKAAPHSIKRLRALGWTGTDLSDLAGIDAQEVEVRVYWETFNEKESMKVEIVTGGTVVLSDQARHDERGKKQFAARFANLVKSIPSAEAPKAAANGRVPF